MFSADEEAGGAGDQPNEQDPAIEQPPRQHTSLTHRLSSLYESLLSKAAPKKSAAAAAASNPATEPAAESKVGHVPWQGRITTKLTSGTDFQRLYHLRSMVND